MNRTTIIIAAAILGLGLAGCAEPDAGPQAEPAAAPAPEFIAMGGQNTWAMIPPADADPAQFNAWAKDRCGDGDFCKVFAWTDRVNAARAFPMTDAELETLAFSYGVNRNTGYEEVLWDCKRFPQPEAGRCL